MRRLPKIKSRRGRPPTAKKSDALKRFKPKEASFSKVLKKRSLGHENYIDILYQKGVLTFEEVQAARRFWRLYRSYISFLEPPKMARVSFEKNFKGRICEEQEEKTLCLWQQSQKVLKPYGFQGEKLIKKICEDSFLENTLSEKEVCTLKDITHALFQFYKLNG